MITVQTTTGKVNIGGDFNRAVAQVKAVSGRKFDSQSKTWSVPISAEELKKKLCMLPIDLPNGQHITRYGNHYDRNEWQATQEANKVSITHSNDRAVLSAWLRDELGKWIASDKIGFVAGLIETFKLEDQMERGKVQFSTPEKETGVLAIDEEYCRRIYVITSAEQDEEEAIQERIFAKYGVE